MALTLVSADFAHNGPLPMLFTCEGRELSPALAWSGVPARAKSLVLLVDDPDAPDPAAPRTTWAHWLLYDLPTTASGLPQGVRPSALPPGTREGTNDSRRTGWSGPCPPIGRHRYFFHLYALDAMLGDLRRPTRPQLIAALTPHLIERTELVGTYEKGAGAGLHPRP